MDDVLNKIPTQEISEKRFTFIKNKTLRTNVVIAFRYMFFLLILNDKYKLPGPISYSIYKNIIIYTATIAESAIQYCLSILIDLGKIKSADIMTAEWKEKSSKDLYKISETEKVSGVIKYKTTEKFTDNIQFQLLNRAALRAGLFDKPLFDKAEELREKRNRIHLAGLKEVDDLYGEQDLKNAFNATAEIIKTVEYHLQATST